MQERQFLKCSYRTNIADIKSMARELRELGWVKADYADRVEIRRPVVPRQGDGAVSGSAVFMVAAV